MFFKYVDTGFTVVPIQCEGRRTIPGTQKRPRSRLLLQPTWQGGKDGRDVVRQHIRNRPDNETAAISRPQIKPGVQHGGIEVAIDQSFEAARRTAERHHAVVQPSHHPRPRQQLVQQQGEAGVGVVDRDECTTRSELSSSPSGDRYLPRTTPREPASRIALLRCCVNPNRAHAGRPARAGAGRTEVRDPPIGAPPRARSAGAAVRILKVPPGARSRSATVDDTSSIHGSSNSGSPKRQPSTCRTVPSGPPRR